MQLMMEVQINNQEFKLIFDIGSSETWVASQDVKCINPRTGLEAAQSECKFGNLFLHDASLEPSRLVFDLKYSHDSWVTGNVFHLDMSSGPYQPFRQLIGIANRASWESDEISSGVCGFGFPSL